MAERSSSFTGFSIGLLPVSSLAWSVFLPGRNLYSGRRSDLAPQTRTGSATWLTPPVSAEEAGEDGEDGGDGHADGGGDGDGEGGPATAPAAAGSAESGEMPVRIASPRTVTRLEHERYWLARGAPVEVTFVYARRWLRLPALLAFGLLAAAGAFVAARAPRRGPRRVWRALGLAALVAAVWPLDRYAGGFAVALALAAGLALAAALALRKAPVRAALAAWLRALRDHVRERRAAPPAAPRPHRWLRAAWDLGLAAALVVALVAALGAGWDLLAALVLGG